MSAAGTAPTGFPRGALLAAAGMIALSLAAAVAGRLTGPVANVGPTTEIDSRALRFEDRDDGGVGIFDPASNALVEIAPPGTNGFLRATLRGLARERRAVGAGPEAPFRLTHWADGRLTLDDPSTGRRVEMVAFGETNAEVFARLLDAKRTPK